MGRSDAARLVPSDLEDWPHREDSLRGEGGLGEDAEEHRSLEKVAVVQPRLEGCLKNGEALVRLAASRHSAAVCMGEASHIGNPILREPRVFRAAISALAHVEI